MALRLQLWLDLPLSQEQVSYDGRNSQFWDVPIEVRFGSPADLRKSITRTSACEGNPAPPRSVFEINNLNVCFHTKQSLR